ncbi:Metabotropic glutamate receptor 6 [Strongyloides ratti]|uniref:Metabotropic glutamate receptor 6 n=1 Tax=Strongyloides ratti TaxID=34506 RepID=A0A090KRU7_STRRB|nr:Metabotropic glutamate receptor 6 [Strongyloides ratti]CEF60194.1 Metabotropic glutamate receptor 6 [Strongyloides ratti]
MLNTIKKNRIKDYNNKVYLYLLFYLTQTSIVNPIREVYIDGDILLGGLFPIHEAGRNGQACGRIKADQGVQRMVAMLYALDEINNDNTILPGIKLGAQIFDTCSHDTYALEQSIVFIKTLLSSQSSLYCPEVVDNIGKRPTVSAVIGAASSTVSLMVASMLQLFKIPMLSYSSTGVELSEKPRFEYFSRMVPPDNLQAKAMAFLVAKLGWNYVHAVADTGSYGERGIDMFRGAAHELGVCIDGEIHKVSRKMSDDAFREMIVRMRYNGKARGVVMFVDEDNLRRFLSILKRLIETPSYSADFDNYFWFIASDSWGTKTSVIKDFENIVKGSITIAPTVKTIKGFDEYFKNLNYLSNTFLTEYWQFLNCTHLSDKTFSDCFKNNGVLFKQEVYAAFVVDAVKTIAIAMHNYIIDECHNFNWYNCSLSKKGFVGSKIQERYRNKSLIPNEPPLIDSNGDGIGKYSIYQLNKYGIYKKVGNWNDGDNMKLKVDEVRRGLISNKFEIPLSVCSEPCGKGSYKAYQDQTCCWTCIKCDTTTSIILNETLCQECPLGEIPNDKQNECYPIPPIYMKWQTLWVLIPSCVSIIGILSTLFVITVFLRYNNTPIVMASGRELCYCMLFGITLCYCVTFILVSKPSVFICGASRLLMGLSMSFVYAAILVKTNRLARVFTLSGPVRPKCISPLAQVLICMSIVGAQLIGSIIFLVWDPTEVIILYPTRTEAVLSCKATSSHLLLSLAYNILLIILCTIYAFKTRKIPENFNETRLIGFTMYSTSILWLSFGPIYFATQNNFRIQITSLCMCISLSGSVALACFFFPKVYIVLWQPYKNVRTRQSAVGKLVNSQMRFISHLATNNTEQNGNILSKKQSNYNEKSTSSNNTTFFETKMTMIQNSNQQFVQSPIIGKSLIMETSQSMLSNEQSVQKKQIITQVLPSVELTSDIATNSSGVSEVNEKSETSGDLISFGNNYSQLPNKNIFEFSDFDDILSEDSISDNMSNLNSIRIRRRSSPNRLVNDQILNERQKQMQLILGKIKADTRVTSL